ncbi:pimeloyl-ACP methyl ester carboxylesterase [Pseudomonas sp. EB276 TE3739]|uniref:alpha/beta fold hydrolase n=1 Tax=Pseudomonas TaxID=286 RepID=UPI00209E0D4E|nr:alpha/beta hydrolase [Pseudomonas koreensis]MCP1475649.1 pimeloyl-ACP methyl ester carboxylesterase [Pseudomonas koreensis]
MGFVTTRDGVDIFYKDWGPRDAPVIHFHHGWPLSSDDWDAQMLFFLAQGFRVIAHDRRGHGRSSQVWDGHDMDHYADDVLAVVNHLGTSNVVHVGHSTGGGEVIHYIARHGQDKVSKAVLISAVPPLMVQTESNPGRFAEIGVRWLSGAIGSEPGAVLSRCAERTFLRLQPSWRRGVGRDHRQLVAARHDRRRQGALRRHRRVFAD